MTTNPTANNNHFQSEVISRCEIRLTVIFSRTVRHDFFHENDGIPLLTVGQEKFGGWIGLNIGIHKNRTGDESRALALWH